MTSLNGWIEINDVIPQSPMKVLLFASDEDAMVFEIGDLGGCKNAPELVYTDFYTKDKKVLRATHWKKLEAP